MIVPHSQSLRENLSCANRTEYGPAADQIPWISLERALLAEAERAQTLAALAPHIDFACKETKPHLGPLSPGCQICGQGRWSCLFINGRCNCRCFYCPTSQEEISVPTTNRIPFDTPDDYVDYVRHFGFSGVSISGGEPLLTLDRAADYIQAVRQAMGPALYIWLYTNGVLATRETLRKLRRAGLDEIRFDISAADYDLGRVRMAADLIGCVTVEIPAIPEDADRLIALLPHLHAAGVRHLNLHQLRLTPYNLPRLMHRGYTFLHGESVTVLESETAALRVLQAAALLPASPAVNYCAFAYKRRYQKAATRRRNAEGVRKKTESITENGFLRTLTLSGTPDVITPLANQLAENDIDQALWQVTGARDRLIFHESLHGRLAAAPGALTASYAEAVLDTAVSYRCAFHEIRLASGRKIYIEKRPIRRDLPVPAGNRECFGEALFPPLPIPGMNGCDEETAAFEYIRPGLQDYF